MTQGLQLPYSIYEYLEKNFFKWICNTSSETGADALLDPTQTYLDLKECECKGHDYSGMPTLDLLVNRTQASRDQDDNFYYSFPPSQFELFPKVNPVLRTTFCDLGIWNLREWYPNVTQTANLQFQWGLGQVFIRQNGLNLKWQYDDENDQYYATVSMKAATDTIENLIAFITVIAVLIALSLYVGILTRYKFSRIRQQHDQFKKIKILTSNFELEVDPDFQNIFKAQQADRDFVQSKEGALNAVTL